MVDDGAEMIEKRRPVAAPARIVIRERALMAALPGKLLQEAERWSEDDGPMAPATQPAVVT